MRQADVERPHAPVLALQTVPVDVGEEPELGLPADRAGPAAVLADVLGRAHQLGMRVADVGTGEQAGPHLRGAGRAWPACSPRSRAARRFPRLGHTCRIAMVGEWYTPPPSSWPAPTTGALKAAGPRRLGRPPRRVGRRRTATACRPAMRTVTTASKDSAGHSHDTSERPVPLGVLAARPRPERSPLGIASSWRLRAPLHRRPSGRSPPSRAPWRRRPFRERARPTTATIAADDDRHRTALALVAQGSAGRHPNS